MDNTDLLEENLSSLEQLSQDYLKLYLESLKKFFGNLDDACREWNEEQNREIAGLMEEGAVTDGEDKG